jgi:putative transposase
MEWGAKHQINITHIQPDKQQQKCLYGNFNRTVIYEWSSQNYLQCMEEGQDFAMQWMYKYKH